MADKPKIDTGSGGFDVDGQSYTFDTGLPDAEGGAHGPVDHGNVSVDKGAPKDLTKPTRETLGRYLSELTKGKHGAAKGVANRYSIDPTQADPTKISDTTGNPPVLESAPNGSAAFSPDIPDIHSSQYTTLKPGLQKGKSSTKGVDGNDLLPLRNGGAQLTQKYSSAVLANNRFTEARRMIATTDLSDTPPDYNPSVAPQEKLGHFDPNATRVTMGRLAQVGPVLSLRAGLELNATSAGANANDTGTEAGAILPGVAQLAVRRVEQRLLLARDVLDTLTMDEVPEANYVSPGSLSWGTLNNVDDQFSGIAALGMAALSTGLVAGLLLVLDAFSTIIGLITPSVKHASRDVQGRYALGSYFTGQKKSSSGGLLGAITAAKSFDIGSLLGLNPTNYPFGMALKMGSKAFFGIEDVGILGTLVGAASQGLSADAGHSAIIARTIIRSSLTIIDQLKKIGGNPINAVKQALSLVDVLKSSKIIAACNVFAQLGDAILSIPDDMVDGEAVGSKKVSAIDAAMVESAVSTNRLKGTLKLAWSSNRAPTNLLVSQNVATAAVFAKNLGSYDVHAGALSPLTRASVSLIKEDKVSRITPEDAAAFEDILDGEYVPFYFHDIRTNEMIGFHAFLTSLTDDYTANYENVDAYGRVESVKIYKNTARKINLSFYIVATSLNDFDDMWVKINKLTTLVYPQFTPGKQLSGGKYTFTQPFSQLIGAAPLVRIRLGDLFKSNYSRFNLARLFGLGDTKFTLDGHTFAKSGEELDQEAISQLPERLEAAKAMAGMTFIPVHGIYQQSTDKGGLGGGLGVSVGIGVGGLSTGGDKPTHAPTFTPLHKYCFDVKIVREDPNDSRNVIGEIQVTTDPEQMKALSTIMDAIKHDYDDPNKPLQRYVGGRYVFPKVSLLPTRWTHDAFVAEVVGITENDEFIKPLIDFMNPDKNALVKSFKETGGKGLAGFIESINFDWYDKVTWETGVKDRIAPKMCKVTIGFAPIHDITPGLDHYGSNRGPLYPIGPLAQRGGK